MPGAAHSTLALMVKCNGVITFKDSAPSLMLLKAVTHFAALQPWV